MKKPNVLFINGVPDDRVVEVAQVKNNGGIIYKSTGTCDLYSYLKTPTFEKHLKVLDLGQQSQITIPQDVSVIVNQISEPDTHKKTLLKMRSLQKVFLGTIAFINQPHRVMQTGREVIFEKLQALPGINIPKTIRMQPRSPRDVLDLMQTEKMVFPVIIREAGAHGGKTTLLLQDTEAVENLFSIAMDGRDFYLTQFVDYRRDGLYHKYRIIVIDGEAHLRHLRTTDHWMIHRKTCQTYMESHPEVIVEESTLLDRFEVDLKPQIQPLITEIYQRIQLEYFGIDCDIQPDGRLLLFEVNANMLTLRDFEKSQSRYQHALSKMQAAIVTMIQKRIAPNKPNK